MRRGRVLSKDLAKLIDAVGKWRDEHGGGGRGKKVPEEFWKEAVRVARTDGVWLTAKEARFNASTISRSSSESSAGKARMRPTRGRGRLGASVNERNALRVHGRAGARDGGRPSLSR